MQSPFSASDDESKTEDALSSHLATLRFFMITIYFQHWQDSNASSTQWPLSAISMKESSLFTPCLHALNSLPIFVMASFVFHYANGELLDFVGHSIWTRLHDEHLYLLCITKAIALMVNG